MTIAEDIVGALRDLCIKKHGQDQSIYSNIDYEEQDGNVVFSFASETYYQEGVAFLGAYADVFDPNSNPRMIALSADNIKKLHDDWSNGKRQEFSHGQNVTPPKKKSTEKSARLNSDSKKATGHPSAQDLRDVAPAGSASASPRVTPKKSGKLDESENAFCEEIKTLLKELNCQVTQFRQNSDNLDYVVFDLKETGAAKRLKDRLSLQQQLCDIYWYENCIQVDRKNLSSLSTYLMTFVQQERQSKVVTKTENAGPAGEATPLLAKPKLTESEKQLCEQINSNFKKLNSKYSVEFEKKVDAQGYVIFKFKHTAGFEAAQTILKNAEFSTGTKHKKMRIPRDQLQTAINLLTARLNPSKPEHPICDLDAAIKSPWKSKDKQRTALIGENSDTFRIGKIVQAIDAYIDANPACCCYPRLFSSCRSDGVVDKIVKILKSDQTDNTKCVEITNLANADANWLSDNYALQNLRRAIQESIARDPNASATLPAGGLQA
jgi:hypothetical protein